MPQGTTDVAFFSHATTAGFRERTFDHASHKTITDQSFPRRANSQLKSPGLRLQAENPDRHAAFIRTK